ncbi:helix-turn-helix transcriptional regulator [Agarivorans sp. QJM3NY_25]|uniref:helix-turn-helix transcriptional regulator n=1 Tax=Agarivorans sp. QJM3NY_25 TaxID=3421430 RepID=UPI003D7D3C3F
MVKASKALEVVYYQGVYQQRLRNVSLLVPSIIWVRKGTKQLSYRQGSLDLDASHLFIVAAHERFTFVNLPLEQCFHSTQFCFHIAPEASMLKRSLAVSKRFIPVVTLSPAMQQTLLSLSAIDLSLISDAVQSHWVAGVYQQLAEEGALHLLFPTAVLSFSQQLCRFLQQNLAAPSLIDDACQHFAISRATLIRRLKAENTQFGVLLRELRMNHALGLMQAGLANQLELAIACGYLSQSRFSQRFTEHFGLSPKQYRDTLALIE